MTTTDRQRIGQPKQQSSGSVFNPDSSACHAALNELLVVLKEVGFVVNKKRDSESTLRVYVHKRLTYPLLNPRFQHGPIRSLEARSILEVTALSKGDKALERRLR